MVAEAVTVFSSLVSGWMLLCLITEQAIVVVHPIKGKWILRYIDTVFLDQQNQDNQINAKCEKNLVHYIEYGCLLLNE